jgi:hypothetical protein
VGELHRALADAVDQHALADLVGGVFGRAEQLVEARDERFDVRCEDAAGVEVGEEVLHREQRVDLLVGEPQAGQLKLGPARLGRVEAVAAEIAVGHDRHVHRVAQAGDVALEGGWRCFERFEEGTAAYHPPFGEELADADTATSGVPPTIKRPDSPAVPRSPRRTPLRVSR